MIICQDAIAMSQNIWINLPVKDVEKVYFGGPLCEVSPDFEIFLDTGGMLDVAACAGGWGCAGYTHNLRESSSS